MGRGIAEQAVVKCPELPQIYGELLLGFVRPGLAPGKQPKMADLDENELIQADLEQGIIFFPTKLMWDLPSDPLLITKALAALKTWLLRHPGVEKVAIPRLGAGNGRLNWETDVKPLVRAFLESLDEKTRSKLIIVSPPPYLGRFQVE